MPLQPFGSIRAGSPAAQDRQSAGQDLVEFALVFPILLILTFVIIDLARVVFSYNTMANAAREGARYGIVQPKTPDPTDAIENQAKRLTAGLPCAPEATFSRPTTTTVRVQVDCNVPLITGVIPALLGGPSSFHLMATATMNIE